MRACKTCAVDMALSSSEKCDPALLAAGSTMHLAKHAGVSLTGSEMSAQPRSHTCGNQQPHGLRFFQPVQPEDTRSAKAESSRRILAVLQAPAVTAEVHLLTWPRHSWLSSARATFIFAACTRSGEARKARVRSSGC